MKRLVFFLSFTILIGCGVEQDPEQIDKAEASVERYLKANFQNVESVEFNNSPSAPMGGLVLEGTVNGEATFNIGVNEDYTVGGIGKGEGFPERKEACREHSCDYGQQEE
ncbi:DUF1433 domain-containing protein [Guptibacillus hwajinpoensis]|uniref:DUF1433 domain-containing protein n=1 Tax=Guptibacillus hwajinpoensis TaxID=208199 RepID=UPI001CFE3406|nr:DUF1433 domain-containing protein [Pseudalkalibacillus hwajinpoensis]WLR59084.1 DUF1433 domain-containing protein [Pseudalkalibacillus hwajinpoensis]